MKIFLLEDELSQQIRVEKHIAEIAKELEIKLEVISTGKISEFENYIQHSDIHQLYFLDIHIQDNEYCGLEIAQKIREANPYAIIVFITTKSEFASITYRYKVSALDFIDKNLNEDLFRLKIKECIEYLATIQIGNDDLADYFEKKGFSQDENTVVVAPDIGSVKRARELAKWLEIPLAIIKKRKNV